MPQDAKCPKCSHIFPVTEARHAFTVTCPRCESDLTVEFKKPSTAPEAGQPPYDLLVKPGALPGTTTLPATKKRRDTDDEDEPVRRGGSVMIVLLTGGLGLLLVVGGLALTGWFLFTQVDVETVSNRSNNGNRNSNRKSNNNQNNNSNKNKTDGVNPAPSGGGTISTPSKPKDTFDLKPITGSIPAISVPTLPADPSNLDLGGKVGQLAIGGGGRYIVMHFPEKGQLGVFDASTARLNVIPADSGDAKLAAGLSRVVLYLPGTNIMRVYSLPNLTKEYDASSPVQGLRSIAMGSRTNGPMLGIHGGGDPVLIEVNSDGVKEIQESRKEWLGLHWEKLRAAPDGTAFTTFDGWRPGQKTTVLTVKDRKWHVQKDIAEVPFFGVDGNLYGNGVVMSQEGKDQRVGGVGRDSGIWYVPAASNKDFFLKVSPMSVGEGFQAKKTIAVSIHTNRNADIAAKDTTSFSALPAFEDLMDRWSGKQPEVALDEHLILVPEAKLLIILNKNRDHLVLRKINSNE